MKKCLLVSVLAMFVVGGCGTTPVDRETQEQFPVLTWYVPGDKQPDMAAVMKAANEIVEPAIGATINLQMMDSGGFQEKMNMMMAAGEVFDMLFTGAGCSYDNAVNRGGLLDITNMLDQEAPKLRDVVRDYAFKDVTRDGKIYGVPNMQIMAGNRSLVILKKYADEYGLNVDEIEKMDDIEPFLAWVKEAYPELYPFHTGQGVGSWDIREYMELGSTMGISHEELTNGKTDKEVVWLRDTEIGKHAIDTLHSWYTKGYIRSDVLSIQDDSLDRKAGKYVVATGLWKPGAEADHLKQTGLEAIYIKLDVPTYVGGATNTMISISRTSQNPVESLKFIELINTDKELYNLIAFGIEGEHYTKNDDGKISTNPTGGYFHNASWKFGNVFNGFVQEGQLDTIWEDTMKLNDESEVSPLLGFVLDPQNISTEISAVASILSQYKVVGCGAENPSVYWDEFKKKLDVAGLEKIRLEYQKQIREFLEKT